MIKTDCGKSKITIVSYKLVYSFLVNFIYCNEVFMGSGTALSLSLSLSLSLFGGGGLSPTSESATYCICIVDWRIHFVVTCKQDYTKKFKAKFLSDKIIKIFDYSTCDLIKEDRDTYFLLK